MADLHFTPIQLPKFAKRIAGEKFNRLTAIAPVSRNNTGSIMWLFNCDCGNWHIASGSKVTSGKTSSCGCFRLENATRIKTTHGLYGTPEYRSYRAMKTRCLNKRNPAYPSYGGRGITICDRWLDSFETFLSDMGERPSANYSLERIDNNAGYAPDNCKWATRAQQCNNRRTSVTITIGDKTLTIAQWSKVSGIGDGTIRFRLKSGWSANDAVFTQPIRRKK